MHYFDVLEHDSYEGIDYLIENFMEFHKNYFTNNYDDKNAHSYDSCFAVYSSKLHQK